MEFRDAAKSEALRRLARDPARLDSLDLYAHVAGNSDRPISDIRRIEAATTTIRDSLVAVTGEASALHGWRAQALFEAMVASLGRVRLLKMEDSGNFYISGPPMRPSDFRLVTEDGEQVLVEVKGFYQRRPTDDFRIRRRDLVELERYAKLLDVPRLMLAVYWVRWNLWTLTNVAALLQGDGDYVHLPMPDALISNEMEVVGDRTLATEWPLTLTFVGDTNQPRSVVGDEVRLTIASVEVRVAGRLITRPNEKSIVFRLMLHSNWTENTHVDTTDGEVVALRFEFSPEQAPTGQEFALHAPLSSIFSTMFSQSTTDAEGEITSLRLDIDPGALAQLVPDDYEGEALRIWSFQLRPSS